MTGEVFAEDASEVTFGGAGGRAVVVGEVEVGDAEVEGTEDEGAGVFLEVDVAEVVPEAEGEAREEEAAFTATAVFHVCVAGGVGLVVHRREKSVWRRVVGELKKVNAISGEGRAEGME